MNRTSTDTNIKKKKNEFIVQKVIWRKAQIPFQNKILDKE